MQILFLAVATLINAASGDAGLSSHIQGMQKFSPPEVRLSVEPSALVHAASVDYYVRKVDGNTYSAWEPIGADHHRSATEAVYTGNDGDVLEFRSSVHTENASECVTFADFEDFNDWKLIAYIGSEFGFRCDYAFDPSIKTQGKLSLLIKVQSENEKLPELPKGAMIGFPLTSKIPIRDWSHYKYFEFDIWEDTPEPLEFMLRCGEKELRKQVRELSTDGRESKQWHKISLDLDREFGKPEERTKIDVCAFAFPILDSLQTGRSYQVRFDAMRLWSSYNKVRTTIDATPPSLPGKLTSHILPGEIEWTWDAGDEESGIAGYSFLWGKDHRKKPNDQLDFTEIHSVKIPFVRPQSYSTYYFQIKAQNKAGLWSDVAEKSIAFNPSEYQ